MLKRWNLSLVVGTFLLSIFGTFITRSGVIASVHSFAQSNVGYFFLVFLVTSGAAAFALLYLRWPQLEPDTKLESLASREAAFLFNNLVLVGIAFSVLWGTLFPILSEAVRGVKITVGPPFFNRVNIPLGLALLALTGIGPLIAWRKASTANLQRQFVGPLVFGAVTALALLGLGIRDGWAIASWALAAFVLGTIIQEFYRGVRARIRMYDEAAPTALVRLVNRNRRRYGGYLVHVGILLCFAAFAGMAFKVTEEVTLSPGQTAEVRGAAGHVYTFKSLGVSQYNAFNRIVTAATLEVTRDGKPLGVIKSEKRQHVDSFGNKTFEPSTEVGIRSGLREDIYVVYAGSIGGTEQANFAISINPLVWWVWFGGVVLVAGGLLAMWPGGRTTAPVTRRDVQAGFEAQLVGTEAK